jgi:hypothetical protein
MAAYARRQPQDQVLYQVVDQHLGPFLETVQPEALPAHVEREFHAFLACGVFACGAAQFFCDGCGRRGFVPLSCKRRGFCPSCLGRRMNDIAHNLCSQVFPDVPVRQWVLSLPIDVRFLLLRQPKLLNAVLALFLRVVSRHLREAAARAGVPGGQAGAVTMVQRFGDGTRLNLHIHSLLPDGVFVPGAVGAPARFVPVPAPSKEELAGLAVRIRDRIRRLLRKRGLLPEGVDEALLGGPDGPLLSFQAAAAGGRIAVGPRAGWRVLRVGGVPVSLPPTGLCADADGDNLHAGVHVPAGQRGRLLSLCRYVLRPPLSQDHLDRLPDGRIRVTLKKPYSDGTTALVFEPLDLLAKLAALVPPPRIHQIRYHGVFAPRAGARAAVVAGAGAEAPPARATGRRDTRHPWAELLQKTFAIDILDCPCGGRLRFLCWVFDPGALRAIEQSLNRQQQKERQANPARGSP